VISTVDPETRHAHKTVHQRRNGFKAHVVVEPVTGLVTATRVTKASEANSADATVGIKLLATDTTLPKTNPGDGAARTPERVEVLGDSAYGTGEALDALGTAGHTAIIKPWPLRPAIPGGFTIEDFTVDETAGTVTCPERVDPEDQCQAEGDVRGRVCRVPAAGAVHHRCPRTQTGPAPA